MNQAIYTGATFVVQTLQDVPLLRQINEANSMKPNFGECKIFCVNRLIY